MSTPICIMDKFYIFLYRIDVYWLGMFLFCVSCSLIMTVNGQQFSIDSEIFSLLLVLCLSLPISLSHSHSTISITQFSVNVLLMYFYDHQNLEKQIYKHEKRISCFNFLLMNFIERLKYRKKLKILSMTATATSSIAQIDDDDDER